MTGRPPRVGVLLLLALFVMPERAAAGPDSLTVPFVPPDSLARFRIIGADSLAVAPSTGGKSPGTALLYSALLPGAGQVYNESYWKVPIIVGFGVFFTSQWLHYNRLAQDAREKYEESLLTDPDGDQFQLQLREFYKDERDTYTWYLLILYVLNLADAYVDASLYDFSVSDDLSLRVIPEGPARVALRITF